MSKTFNFIWPMCQIPRLWCRCPENRWLPAGRWHPWLGPSLGIGGIGVLLPPCIGHTGSVQRPQSNAPATGGALAGGGRGLPRPVLGPAAGSHGPLLLRQPPSNQAVLVLAPRRRWQGLCPAWLHPCPHGARRLQGGPAAVGQCPDVQKRLQIPRWSTRRDPVTSPV